MSKGAGNLRISTQRLEKGRSESKPVLGVDELDDFFHFPPILVNEVDKFWLIPKFVVSNFVSIFFLKVTKSMMTSTGDSKSKVDIWGTLADPMRFSESSPANLFLFLQKADEGCPKFEKHTWKKHEKTSLVSFYFSRFESGKDESTNQLGLKGIKGRLL